MPHPKQKVQVDSIDNEIYDLVIVGAGFAGTFTAIKASKLALSNQQLIKILFLDAGDEILSAESTSLNQCGKLHLGLHYVGDKLTAIQCLENSLDFVDEYGDFLLGKGNDPSRRGTHIFLSKSVESFHERDQIYALKETLTDIYRKRNNPERNVFGSNETFIQEIDKSKYPYVAKKIMTSLDADGKKEECEVVLAFETGESQIDIPKIKSHLQKIISDSPNVTFKSHHYVTGFSYVEGSFDYMVNGVNKETREPFSYRTRSVVNCTWQEIEKLDNSLSLVGAYEENKELYIRLKISIVVELCEELKKLNLKTCIFSKGPHVSVTCDGKGYALITYEPDTNVLEFKSGEKIYSERDLKLMHDKLKPTEGLGKELADLVLEGARRYIPLLSKSKALHVWRGYVKTFKKPHESISIYDPQSAIIRRQEDGVLKRGFCFFAFNGMKTTYTLKGAKKVCMLLKEDLDFRLEKKLDEEIKNLNADYKLYFCNIFRHFVIDSLQLNLTFNYISRYIKNKLQQKNALNQSFVEYFEQRDKIKKQESFLYPTLISLLASISYLTSKLCCNETNESNEPIRSDEKQINSSSKYLVDCIPDQNNNTPKKISSSAILKREGLYKIARAPIFPSSNVSSDCSHQTTSISRLASTVVVKY